MKDLKKDSDDKNILFLTHLALIRERGKPNLKANPSEIICSY